MVCFTAEIVSHIIFSEAHAVDHYWRESQKCVVTRMLRSVSVLKMGLFIFNIWSCDSAVNRQRRTDGRELKPLLKHSWIQINCVSMFSDLPLLLPGRGDADCFKYFSDKSNWQPNYLCWLLGKKTQNKQIPRLWTELVGLKKTTFIISVWLSFSLPKKVSVLWHTK